MGANSGMESAVRLCKFVTKSGFGKDVKVFDVLQDYMAEQYPIKRKVAQESHNNYETLMKAARCDPVQHRIADLEGMMFNHCEQLKKPFMTRARCVNGPTPQG